ncbi:MAG: TIGR03936 family radical SAM-associated protein [Oscillospiraceae bacterium]|jgi:radical SAM-linked protein|nr:TIGR03936 family radical SAM-associated protein [Oscillospiraceae bacterium]
MNVRVFFKKIQRAKYISHLDLYRAMGRAVKRAELPVWFTEGFNPHIYMTFALPLALGIEGENEPLDLRLTEEMPFSEITEKLNAALCGAEGLSVNSAAAPARNASEIEKARYEIVTSETEKLADFFSRPEIIIEKKTKNQTRIIDIKPLIRFSVDDSAFSVVLPAGAKLNVNPWQVLGAFSEIYGEREITNVKRTGILCADGKEFTASHTTG